MKNNYLKIIFMLTLVACSQDQHNNENTNKKLIVATAEKMNSYWYDKGAEISSYTLTQARYGELHQGQAVLVYVTEPFSLTSNTKADHKSPDNIEVIKLNRTKNFNTGIYPYSMMTSSFFPFKTGGHSLKITSSSQEWCGHTFMEVTNKKDFFEANLASYFEGESFKNRKIDTTVLEDDVWTKIRLDPTKLMVGKIEMVPSLFYLRLMHKEFKSYKSIASLKALSDSTYVYELSYSDIKRTLSIEFQNKFPFKILTWQERYESGWGEKKKWLTTEAKLLKTIHSDYWNHHTNADLVLREALKLK